ncbi:hypothetical protein [Sulfurivirga sp.]|uniref:hypothetical protein n=1 Tax=Sulfurivirga sp. TaxID=2614236 RepID=UPI0025E00891|nr:hypothetical protein [Sulfurivirga sp.]
MAAFVRIALIGLMLVLAACNRPPSAGPDPAQIKSYVSEQFAKAYGRWLELDEVALKPAESTLNDTDHRVYDVTLEAVVTRDLRKALKALPETPQNLEARGRIKGILSMGGAEPGRKITARLRALVERNPDTGQWSVVGLIRHSEGG